ncbi:MAG: three-Cys-motif partner protein TcmP [Thermoanaerobaculia bacterium]
MKSAGSLEGDWSEKKLSVLADYLASYTTALSKQRLGRIYVDAFAGNGSDGSLRGGADTAGGFPLEFVHGSARIALRTAPRFDRFLFVGASAERSAQLEALRSELPDRAAGIQVLAGDANGQLEALCEWDWRFRRAVLVLDPLATAVDWTTLEAVASTRAIDVWMLLPLEMPSLRTLSRCEEIHPEWRRRIDTLLGTTDWAEDFCRAVQLDEDLFGEFEERLEKAAIEMIGRPLLARLATVFAGVAEKPVVLRNSENCPLYLLCFAVGNEKGKKMALETAQRLMSDLR